MEHPSILNDVIGPVMRGPSSSHCAAAVRIGRMAGALMAGKMESVLVEFDTAGSLPTTHTSQGSDMGLCAGLLGLSADDERMTAYEEQMAQANIHIQYSAGNFGDTHPNTYRITLRNSEETHFIIALSIGGGMIEVIAVDHHKLSMQGDCHETLIFFSGTSGPVTPLLEKENPGAVIFNHGSGDKGLIEIKSRFALPESLVKKLLSLENIISVRPIPPVMPVLTPEKLDLPFADIPQMFAYHSDVNTDLADLALEYESRRGETTKKDILDRMITIVSIMKASIHEGLQGTRYPDRILGRQSDKFEQHMKQKTIMDLGVLNTIILYATAIMEVKSAMGVFVAAPTAGSCGALPGAIIGTADVMGYDQKKIARAMLAAGMIGVFIAKDSTFAAEVGGCQAECGAGSGMAAAGLVTLMGGSLERAAAAASMALQNSFGMVCDPVAGRVEVPCLGKNIMAASNAVSCANMALSGFDPVIPLNEAIHAMDKVGKSIHPDLRCTALGGLSITPASKRIEEKLRYKL